MKSRFHTLKSSFGSIVLHSLTQKLKQQQSIQIGAQTQNFLLKPELSEFPILINILLTIKLHIMGSAIEKCCSADGPSNKGRSPSPLTRKKIITLSTEEANTEQKMLWSEKNGRLVLSDEYILKLLGKLIKIDKQIKGVLGSGAFGVVYLAQLKQNIEKGLQQKYAVKRIAKQLLIKRNMVANIVDERDVLAMSNQFMVSLYMAFQDPWYLYLVMEYASGGDTYSLVKADSFKKNTFASLGQPAVRFIAACVILGLQCLHKHNYMYRDLKPENVLMFQNGYVKLADFGLVKKSPQTKKSMTISGTQFYLAPEMLLQKGYDKEIDFWAIGVFIYELSNFEPPFTSEQITRSTFEDAVRNAENNREWLRQNIGDDLKDLVNRLLKFDVSERLGSKNGWQEVKSHAFFKEFDWNSLENQTIVSPLQKLVDMYPPSVKPYKAKEETNKSQDEATVIQGWSLIKKPSFQN